MDADHLAELYKIRFADNQLPRKNAIWQVICQDYLQAFIPPQATVVDVACGYGEFINHIQAQRKIALDLNPDSVHFLQPNIEFKQCAVSEMGSMIQESADVLFTSNFLEHLPHKQALEHFLDQVWYALKPGGRYFILGPNLRYLAGEYWDFYDHHLGLTDRSLSEILQLKNFTIQLKIARFLPYTTQGRLPTHPLLVKWYLKMPWAWPFFGKQFFIIAQKPY